MAGYGKRCLELGDFKPFIKINDKTIFEYCISNLDIQKNDKLVLVTSVESSPKDCEDTFNKICKHDFIHISLSEVKKGPALTVYSVLSDIKTFVKNYQDYQVHVVNTDQIIKYENINFKGEGCAMPIYFNNHGSSCYVNLDRKFTRISEIKEKKLISGYASSGVYIFSSIDYLNKCIEWGIKNREDLSEVSFGYTEPELFLGPCMNYAIGCVDPVYALTTYCKIDLGSTRAIKENKNNLL